MRGKIIEALVAPEQVHDDNSYMHVEEIKKKGRRKKGEPREYQVILFSWDELNHTELMELCHIAARQIGTRTEMEVWRVVHMGVGRETLIGIILGSVDPKELPDHPVHTHREKIGRFLHANWKYISSQIQCDLECWGCPDVKVMETFFDNRRNMPGELP